MQKCYFKQWVYLTSKILTLPKFLLAISCYNLQKMNFMNKINPTILSKYMTIYMPIVLPWQKESITNENSTVMLFIVIIL